MAGTSVCWCIHNPASLAVSFVFPTCHVTLHDQQSGLGGARRPPDKQTSLSLCLTHKDIYYNIRHVVIDKTASWCKFIPLVISFRASSNNHPASGMIVSSSNSTLHLQVSNKQQPALGSSSNLQEAPRSNRGGAPFFLLYLSTP